MASLFSIANLSFRKCFPNPSDDTDLEVEDFIESAKAIYSYQMLLFYWKQRNEEGEFNLPSNLLQESEIDVVNNKADISKLSIFNSLPNDLWLVNIGGLGCECHYVKSDVNKSQLLCDDDSLSDNSRIYIPVGKEIRFPQGVHKTPIKIIHASLGENIDEDIEIDDALAAVVRDKLDDMYLGRIANEDVTNNSNPNQ